MTNQRRDGRLPSADNGPRGEVPATREELRLGLALSGGGMRAAVFHLGVLGRLAADQLLENVAFISTVSGGSLGAGLVYTLSGNRWPTSAEYLAYIAPESQHLMTTVDMQRGIALKAAIPPWRLLLQGRANVLSEVLKHRWNVRGLVKDLPSEPRWIINATSYESGKNWRFAPHRMGDYETGYVFSPSISVADAMAASAGFPGLIGFLALDTRDYEWRQYIPGSRSDTEPTEPGRRRVHLWDGGVYDNLGVEALFKSGEGLREGYNFLVVSDASTTIAPEQRYRPYRQARRLLTIAMDQTRSLRTRTVIGHFEEHPGSGAYLMMGNTAGKILEDGGLSKEEATEIAAGCMPRDDIEAASQFSTTLRRLETTEFDKLYRHGWEVANCTFLSRHPDIFGNLPTRSVAKTN